MDSPRKAQRLISRLMVDQKDKLSPFRVSDRSGLQRSVQSPSLYYSTIQTSSNEVYTTAVEELSYNDDTITINSGRENRVDRHFSSLILNASKNLRKSFRRHSLASLVEKLPKFQQLSVSHCKPVDIKETCTCFCQSYSYDKNCLEHFMKMSVQPAEYRNETQILSSTPIPMKDMDFGENIFNVARVTKVELQGLKPKVLDVSVIGTPTKDPSFNYNNNNTLIVNGNHCDQQQQQQQQQQLHAIAPLRPKGQLMTNAMTKPLLDDGNVLKKVISFTLEQMQNGNNGDNQTCKSSRPNILTEKLQYNNCDQSEAQTHIDQISLTIAKSLNLDENSIFPIEHFVSVVYSHFIEAGLIKQTKIDEVLRDVCPVISQYTEADTSLEAIKSKLRACDSFTSLYTELKSAMCVIEKHVDETKGKYYEPLNGFCCDDQINDKIESGSHDTGINGSCDNESKRSIDRSTQTENEFEDPLKTETISVIPVPPPLPSSGLQIIITPAENTEVTTVDTPKNVEETIKTTTRTSVPIPPPPPAPILSSASSFCPPPAPPLPAAGIPPPLPLPGKGWFQSDTLRKKPKQPKKPMVGLFWTRILAPVTTKSQLWQKIDEVDLENVDEFAEAFARTATPKKIRESIRLPKKAYRKSLDSKRSQSVGIFAKTLKRLQIDLETIKEAILHCDTKLINLDLLQQLRSHAASTEELNAIMNANAIATPDIPLDAPEKFLLNFSKIPFACERIDCMLFCSDFNETIGQISEKMTGMKYLCKTMVENSNLEELFSIILTLGNFMNGGNHLRGQADGFGLDILGKLRDVKSKDKKMTLLSYITKTYIQKQRNNGLQLKDIGYPVPGVQEINDACSVDFGSIADRIELLKKRFTEFQVKVDMIIKSSTDEDVEPFKRISEEFVQSSTAKIDEEYNALNSCREMFRKTLDFFNHIPKTGTIDECTPSQFFSLWSPFVVDFQASWKKEISTVNVEVRKNKIAPAPKISTPRTPKVKSGLRERKLNQISNLI